MLSEQILAKMKGSSSSEASALSPELEHNMIINLTSPKEDKFLSYQFKLPRVSIQSQPRKNKYLLQYKMGRSWTYDTTNTNRWPQLSSMNLGYEFRIYKPHRMPSRSAKIMRALSSDHSVFRDGNVEIRKSLNFDSTPSSKENSSYDESSTNSISADASSSTLNSSSTDSSDNSVATNPIASVESIDENQNQTPQQNRKYIKISSNRTGTKGNTCIRSRASYLMSLFEAQKANRSNVSSRVITTSTPRNLSQEFNQEVHDRPHTPENMKNVIPESISAIKKSHKKEKLFCHEEQSFTQRTDSIKNNLHPRTTTESLEIDMFAEASCSAASDNESQKKNRNIKRTLIYNMDDELDPDTSSDFDHSKEQKTTSTENDSLESGLDRIESDEMHDIDSNDCESHEENMQVSIHLIDDNEGEEEEEDCSKRNVCDEEVNQLSLQKESSSICNVNVMSKNRMTSPESNPVISRDADKVVTPENHINMVKHILTESIKKSHKKIKHGNKRALFKTKDLHEKMESAKSEISVKDACNDQDIKSQAADTICVTNPQNSDRPSTPENVNSSRLLLLDFNSVKKSHKKDKRSKRTSSFAECHDYEYRKRSNSLRSRYEEANIDGTLLHRNESLGLEESPGMSPKKKKKPVSMCLQSSTPKMPSAFMFLGCKNIDDEFKTCTPIKKSQMLLTVTDHVSADEVTQENDEPATSKEIDCSRCVTPVARCFKGLRENKDLTSERNNAKRFETDISVLKAVDTANLESNGRSTPINMSTMELLCNVDSIKKSHKKDKHSRSRRPISEKKQSYIAESDHVNFANSEKILEEHTTLSLKHHVDNHCTEKEMCGNTREKEKDKSYKEIAYDDPQPSTSHGGDNIENAKNTTKSRLLNTTPPNSLSAINLIKLLHTTSIKKSHKKERDFNAQAKYILMSQEHELSDDGSIFDEEDRLMSFIENDNSTEITTI